MFVTFLVDGPIYVRKGTHRLCTRRAFQNHLVLCEFYNLKVEVFVQISIIWYDWLCCDYRRWGCVNLYTCSKLSFDCAAIFLEKPFEVASCKRGENWLLKCGSGLFGFFDRFWFVVVRGNNVKQEVKSFETEDEVVYESVWNEPMWQQLCKKSVRSLGKFDSHKETQLVLSALLLNLLVHTLDYFRETS